MFLFLFFLRDRIHNFWGANQINKYFNNFFKGKSEFGKHLGALAPLNVATPLLVNSLVRVNNYCEERRW